MTDQEFEELLSIGHELPGLEFKGPGSRTDKLFFAKVVRAILGMANKRDGGNIIIGVEENEGKLNPVGLKSDDLATWQYDDVAAALAPYAGPSVSFHLEKLKYKGKDFVIIRVNEFEDIPILCNKGYDDTLRKGATYVRSRQKPETAEIPTPEDMQNLLDLAIEKGVRKFIARAENAGLIHVVYTSQDDATLFERQAEDFK